MKVKLIECMLTWQGEVFSGKRVLLLRFKNCDRCCSYCDIRNKLESSVEGEYDIDDLQKIIDKEDVGLLITGGEPTYYDPPRVNNYTDTFNLLTKLNYPFAYVESNGCDLTYLYKNVELSDKIHYVFSPKVIFKRRDETSDRPDLLIDTYNYKMVEDIIKTIKKDKLIIKILRPGQAGNKLINYLIDNGLKQNIYLMPEGNTKEKIIKNMPHVLDMAKFFGVNVTTRLHLIHDFE